MVQPSAKTPIADLFPPDGSYVTRESDAEGLAVLERAQSRARGDAARRFAARCPHPRLRAGRADAAQCAGSARYSQRAGTHSQMYGLDKENTITPPKGTIDTRQEIEYFGRNCLVARRLLERGVRFVQVWSGADNGHPRRNWDSHEDLKRDHGPLAAGLGIGASALIKDLKQRGMLDDTIVLWTTEFGRMPCNQGYGRPRSQSVRVHQLARRRRHERRRELRRER